MESPEVTLSIKPDFTPNLQIEQQRPAVDVKFVQFMVVDFDSIIVLKMLQSILEQCFCSNASGKAVLHVLCKPMTPNAQV